MSMNEADFLAKVPIFSLMKRADLERISKQAQRHLFHEGDIIIKENDRDRRLFIILSGEVETVINLGSKKETSLGTFGPLSYFGEMSLIDDLVRSASVVAKEDTQVLSLDQWNLREEINKYPGMAMELLQMLSRRIRDIEKTLLNTLGTFLPICANCRKIRDKKGSWVQIEKYISDHSETKFTHGVCPECTKKLYGEFYKGEE
jgi:CRP/FNR family cyclic AMP-dependent transcriptional regulator